jgi:hypothetical protein
MAAQHRAINRHATARIDEHRVANFEIIGIDIAHSAAAANRDRAWQKIEKVMDCPPAARDGHALEDFGHQHEQRDDEGGEELADRRRGDNAMLMESSMVIRRATMFSAASLKIDHPPTITPKTPITHTLVSGSQTRNHTAAAAKATNAMRAASGHVKSCSPSC